MKLLFVCSGNTCRSPLALAAWRALPDSSRKVEAASAGLAARTGEAASRYSVDIAREWHVDLSKHRARNLDDRLLRETDLFCVMTPEHKTHLIARGARLGLNLETRVQLLGSFAAPEEIEASGETTSLRRLLGDSDESTLPTSSEAVSILDPFNGSREAYQSCATQIQRAVAGLNCALAEGRSETY